MVFMNLPNGVTVQDARGKLIYANKMALTIMGLSESESLINEQKRPEIVFFNKEGKIIETEDLPGGRALKSGKEVQDIVRISGNNKQISDKWSLVVAKPIEKDSKIVGVVNSFYDLTVLKNSEEEMQLLNKLSRELATEILVPTRLKIAAEMLAGKVADWCAVDMVGEGKTIRRTALAGATAEMQLKAEELEKKFPPTKSDWEKNTKFLKENKPVVIEDMTDELIRQGAKNEEHFQLIKKLELSAAVFLPLTTRKRPVGILSFGWAKNSKYTRLKNIDFLENLAQTIAVFLDNGRLYALAKREIMQQKKNQVILKNNENSLRLALEAGRMITWDWDMETSRISWSAGSQKLLNNSGTEVLLETVLEKIADEDRKMVLGKIKYAIKESGLLESDFRINTLENKMTWVHIKGQVLYDGDGDPVRMVGIMSDITERKNNEQKTRESEEKFRLIYTETTDAIMVVDKSGKITDANPAADRLWKMAKKELLHTPFEQLFVNNQTGLVTKEQKTNNLTNEVLITQGDGDRRLVEYDCVRQYIEGKDLYIIRDIHDNRIEQKRREHFLSIASHELKSPLATVKAMVQIGKRQLANKEITKAEIALEKIDEKTNVVVRLINDLLDVTRIREGRLELLFEFFELDEFLREIIEELKITVGTHTIVNNGKTGQTIMADKSRLAQVITNLIRNAAKYSTLGSQIIIDAGVKDKQVWVSVKDFGLGIIEEDKKTLFELYSRGKDTRKEHIKGLGVGLFISANIIKQHGGKMWFESKLEEGSIFYLSLPLRKK